MCKTNRFMNIVALMLVSVALAAVYAVSQQVKELRRASDSSLEDLYVIVNKQADLIAELSVRCEVNRCRCKEVKESTIAVSKVEKPKGLIVIHKMPGCPPCERWLRTEKPKAEAAGWEVRTEEFGGKYNSYPQFRVYADPKKPGVWARGFQTFEQLREAAK